MTPRPEEQTSTSTEFALRGYRAGDVEAMFQLDRLCFEAPFRFSRQEIERFAEAKGTLVVLAEADAAGSLAGFSIVQLGHGRGERHGYVVTLDVAPLWRRRGLARMLLARAERDAAEAGTAGMWLHVFRGNTGGQRLYQSLGYVQSGVEERFYGLAGDAFVYRKTLDGQRG